MKAQKIFIQYGNQTPIAIDHVKFITYGNFYIKFQFDGGGVLSWDLGSEAELNYIKQVLKEKFVEEIRVYSQYKADESRKILEKAGEKYAGDKKP